MPNVLGSVRKYPVVSLRFVGQCLASSGVLALLTYLGFVLRVDLTTISFIDLLLVVMTALLFGFWQASYISLLAAGCLDYFFTRPLFRFGMSDPHDWVALGAFQITALVIGRLSAKELRSAREAAFHRTGMEQLYELSRSSLLLDLHEPPGPQLVVLIQRIFSLEAVALFDAHLQRQDRMGEWGTGEQDAASESLLAGTSQDDSRADTHQRILHSGLQSGTVPVGRLVVRGKISPLVLDALAALAAIAIDRHQSFENEERAETASKSEQLRAAVMDALAHEFKTPLTAVQTASSGLLELGGLSDSQRDLALLIDGEAVRLNELCTRLLLTAKLETQQVGLKTDDANIQEVIAEALTSPAGEEVKHRVVVTVEEPGLTVRADRALLAMILVQLVDNARKYSSPDTPIRIEARAGHGEVILSVHNFGPPIQLEDRERIFDRFYRSAQLKDSIPGTGIGLSAVKKAAEAHHGHVWVISDAKEGTTFFLTLPTETKRNH
ncbi:MAG: ATP-binding protein [Terracidiphilus sp.]|jgi:two-component system sensor histidine kinase KdpD